MISVEGTEAKASYPLRSRLAWSGRANSRHPVQPASVILLSKVIRRDGNGSRCEWRTDQGEFVWRAKIGVKQGIAEQHEVRG